MNGASSEYERNASPSESKADGEPERASVGRRSAKLHVEQFFRLASFENSLPSFYDGRRPAFGVDGRRCAVPTGGGREDAAIELREPS